MANIAISVDDNDKFMQGYNNKRLVYILKIQPAYLNSFNNNW